MHRYRLHRRLGSGSSGDTFLVSGDDGFSVLKRVRLAGLPAEQRRRVYRELHVLRRLTHPNVIALRGAFLHSESLVLDCEYCDAGDLEALISKRRHAGLLGFSEASILGVFVQVARALEYVHAEGVVHRDLKSSNILLTAKGIVKVADFGVAKAAAALDLTSADAGAPGAVLRVVGTIQHLAPEVCGGSAATAESDCWALGVVLFQLCHLQLPFQGLNALSVVLKILEGDPGPLPTTYSTALQELCCPGLLSKTPSRRLTAAQCLSLPLTLAVQRRRLRQAPQRPCGNMPRTAEEVIYFLETEKPFAQLVETSEFERFIERQLELLREAGV